MKCPPEDADHLPQFRGLHDKQADPLFAGGRPARPLRVLLDAAVWDRVTRGSDIFSRTLQGLLHNERVEISLYSDDGPPVDVERMPAGDWARGDEAIGWTVLSASDSPMLAYSVTVTSRSTISESSIFIDEITSARLTLKLEGAEDDEDRDARLIATAQATHVDLLVTDRDRVIASELEDRGNCRFASAAQAIALIALYLRASGEFIFIKDRDFTYDATTARMFFEQITDHAIPSLPEFVRRSQHVVPPARLATLRRRARAIFDARDRLAVLTSVAVTADVIDEVESTFTHAVVDMVAFHDLLARIVGQFLDPPCPPRQCKWQYDGWRSSALAQIPELASTWAEGGASLLIDTALRGMRNEIHDLAPTSVPHRTRWGGAQVGLGFFDGSGRKVAEALNALPDAADRGIERRFADGYLVRPDVLFEFAFPWVLHSVNSTLNALVALLPAREAETPRSALRPEAVAESIGYMLPIRAVRHVAT
jgi:hypothetical protein